MHNERCTPGSGRGARRPTASTQHGAARLFHVVGKRNKPTEVKAKEFTYVKHLKKAFGDVPLNQIGTGEIAEFRASLVEKGLSEKTINNILSILSKPLKYALDVGFDQQGAQGGAL